MYLSNNFYGNLGQEQNKTTLLCATIMLRRSGKLVIRHTSCNGAPLPPYTRKQYTYI